MTKRFSYKRTPNVNDALLGMLYIVEVRLVRRKTDEKIKHKLLLVGCEQNDIERKLRWIFDIREYREMAITSTEKVRDKVHYLSTIVTQLDAQSGPIIEREERTETVYQQRTTIERYDPKLFAIGVTTTMLGRDETHALRKVGHAIVQQTFEGSHSGANLSADSTIQIEEIPLSSGYASPRDVSSETNRARIVRG